MNDYAEVVAPRTVRLQRTLNAPIGKVWSYLTESELRRRWFAGGPLEPKVGGALTLTFHNSELSTAPLPERFAQFEGMVEHSTLTRFEPPHVLGFYFGGEGAELVFELQADGERTLLTLTHHNLASRAAMVDVSGGWHAHVGLLQDLLAGHAPREFWAEVHAAEAEYQRRIPEDA
ncbi:SRPBCC family protein [Phenylobacterium sp. LjRoot219]|uniref:SRPBCC family protein n=1 Tax=Phenylobacterium sp. LjRoot219 TaxID=3342283 RepID=UPI003ECEC5F2